MTLEEITAYNQKRIYDISKRLKYCSDIEELFIKYPKLLKLLREIYRYYKKRRRAAFENKNLFTISAVYISGILREKDIIRTKATANKYLNYLCCVGFFNKVDRVTSHQVKLIKNYKNKTHIRDISAFTFRKYNKPLLMQINRNVRLLRENKITPSNISSKRLQASAIPEINEMAEQIHIDEFNNMVWYSEKALEIFEFIEKDLEINGYTTKSRIYKNVKIKKNNNSRHIDKIISVYRILDDYIYKRPSKAEREKYNYSGNKNIILPCK